MAFGSGCFAFHPRYPEFSGHFWYFGIIFQRSHSNPCSANMNLPMNPRIFLPPQMEDPKSLWEICLPHPWRPEAGSLVERVKSHTVDGSEIWRSPVEVGSLSAIICDRFYISQVVVEDFWTINTTIHQSDFYLWSYDGEFDIFEKMGFISQAQMLWRLWRLVRDTGLHSQMLIWLPLWLLHLEVHVYGETCRHDQT